MISIFVVDIIEQRSISCCAYSTSNYAFRIAFSLWYFLWLAQSLVALSFLASSKTISTFEQRICTFDMVFAQVWEGRSHWSGWQCWSPHIFPGKLLSPYVWIAKKILYFPSNPAIASQVKCGKSFSFLGLPSYHLQGDAKDTFYRRWISYRNRPTSSSCIISLKSTIINNNILKNTLH